MLFANWLGPCGFAGAANDLGAELDATADHRFPACEAVVDVSTPPYSAKGDGLTDDTIAIQRAINDNMGLHKVLYFPNGVYLISATLKWTNKNSSGQGAYGFNWIQGQNPLKTIIRLKDGVFRDSANPEAMMWCGGFGSADWFHNYVQDITFNIGKDNPGATGLQFYSNNTGAVRNVAITSPDGSGATGLDLIHRDMNGPLLIRNLVVHGFRIGIRSGNAVNSQTFEKITLFGQSECGFENQGQAISIRGLSVYGSGHAVRSYGTLSLLEADLTGAGRAGKLPAIVNYNGGRLALRDIRTRGYARAVADVSTPDYGAALRITGPDKPGSEGPVVREYFSSPSTSPFGGSLSSLRLQVEETPDVPWDAPGSWAVVDRFGADSSGRTESSAAIQRAIDSGATTVFFPGAYVIDKPVIVRGRVRRLLGTGNWIDYNGKTRPDFIVEDGKPSEVVIEHFAPVNGGIEIQTGRTVILKSVEANIVDNGKGRLFMEDVATGDFRMHAGKRVWARQLNVENEGTHITNDGGSLWILGYKTERGGTLLDTRRGGQTELFGTFSYTTTAGKLAPMFVTEDSAVFAFFSEVCFSGDPFTTLIRETRKGVVKEIKRGEGAVTPYIGTQGTHH